ELAELLRPRSPGWQRPAKAVAQRGLQLPSRSGKSGALDGSAGRTLQHRTKPRAPAQLDRRAPCAVGHRRGLPKARRPTGGGGDRNPCAARVKCEQLEGAVALTPEPPRTPAAVWRRPLSRSAVPPRSGTVGT